MSDSLRSRLVRLAASDSSLRPHLLPLLKEGMRLDEDHSSDPSYIGDGAYAVVEDGQVVLFTSNGLRRENVIYVEDVDRLIRVLQSLKSQGHRTAGARPLESTLDFLANGWEHGDHDDAVEHLTEVLGNADAANEIMDLWDKERPDLKARGNVMQQQMLMENLVGQVFYKHHIR